MSICPRELRPINTECVGSGPRRPAADGIYHTYGGSDQTKAARNVPMALTLFAPIPAVINERREVVSRESRPARKEHDDGDEEEERRNGRGEKGPSQSQKVEAQQGDRQEFDRQRTEGAQGWNRVIRGIDIGLPHSPLRRHVHFTS